MHLAAYDWRLGVEQLERRDLYFSKLKNTIELAKRVNGQKVVAIAHSMGSNVFYYFLHWVESPQGGNGGPNWVEEHLETFVNLAGPMLGVPKAVAAVVSGEMRDTVQPVGEYILERFYSKSERAALFRTWNGMHSMLPKGGNVIWGDTEHGAPDDLPGRTVSQFSTMLRFQPKESNTGSLNLSDVQKTVEDAVHLGNLTASDTMHLIRTYGGDKFVKLLDQLYSFGLAYTPEEIKALEEHKPAWTNPLESALPNAPSMKIYCLYGVGKETERGYIYTKSCPSQRQPQSLDDLVIQGLGRVPRNMCIDRFINNLEEGIENGVLVGEG
jgi:phospholipid:diacylglycerol acyltransferase